MNYYTERLNNELQNIINFWLKNAISDTRIAPEINNEGIANFSAPLGTVYVSRILYGSSAATKHLKVNSFMQLSEMAYNILTQNLRNPKGGYFWGINADGTVHHDEINASFAQPFVLYGLAEYYSLTGNEKAGDKISEQIDFIENKLLKKKDNSYADGFTYSWNPTNLQYRSLGTHLHLLEAYTKIKEITKNSQYDSYIENILNIILKRFVNLNENRVMHQFDSNWAPVPDENWIGHNVETSWIICDAARILKKPELMQNCKEIAIKLVDHAIETGFDTKYGGMFNRYQKDGPITTDKEWWPQAESVLAFLNAHSLTGDKKYLSFAIRLLEYIDNTFSDSTIGEWYDTVSREGKPYTNIPKTHLWKSMYHNVRYCILTIKHLENLFVPTLRE
jgi:mannobiose 2-epimerase